MEQKIEHTSTLHHPTATMSIAPSNLNPDSSPATRTKSFAVSLGNAAEINVASTAPTNPALDQPSKPAADDDGQNGKFPMKVRFRHVTAKVYRKTPKYPFHRIACRSVTFGSRRDSERSLNDGTGQSRSDADWLTGACPSPIGIPGITQTSTATSQAALILIARQLCLGRVLMNSS